MYFTEPWFFSFSFSLFVSHSMPLRAQLTVIIVTALIEGEIKLTLNCTCGTRLWFIRNYAIFDAYCGVWRCFKSFDRTRTQNPNKRITKGLENVRRARTPKSRMACRWRNADIFGMTKLHRECILMYENKRM